MTSAEPLGQLRSFSKAVGIGSLAGASPGLLVTVPLGLMILLDFNDPMSGWSAVPLMLAPVIVAFPLVLGASLFVGLPLTWLLRHLGRESVSAYGMAGFFVGGMIMIGLLYDAEWGISGGALVACILGMVGGSITGAVWGQERERLVALDSTSAAP